MAARKKTEVTPEIVTIKEEAKTRNTNKTEIPMNYEIPVKSNVSGGLTYVNAKNGNFHRWDQTGDVDYLEYSELLSMRNTARKFFENNWIVVEDSDYTADEVYRALSVAKYYSFNLDNLDDFFSLSEKEMNDIVSKISNGFKKNLINRAKTLKNEKSDLFDSSKRVAVIEKVLGVTFDDDIIE